MPVKTRVDSIASDIRIFIDQNLSPSAQSKAFANYAAGEIAKGDEKNRRVLGRVPPRVTTVDGQKGAPLDRVRPNGSIITEWELIGDVLIWIGEKLRDRSPVVSGKYRDAHTLFADGREVDLGGEIPVAEEYVFLNPLPYARKIEIGKTKEGRDFVIQVPNRIYERTANDAKRRFGNLAKIRFSYRASEDSSIVKYVALGGWARDKRGRFSKTNATDAERSAHMHERSLRVPAIVVSLKAN